MEANKIAFQRIIDSIDGSIQSQGIKVKFPAWMVMGSKEWDEATDKLRAYAYQAALTTGWTNKSLIKAVCAVYEHVSSHTALTTIELLEDLAKEYKLEVVGKERKLSKVTFIGEGGICHQTL